jgi:hypothetical protein
MAVTAAWPVLTTYEFPAGFGLVALPVLATLAVTAVTAARSVTMLRMAFVAPCAALALVASFAPLYIGGIASARR